jgi:hypothetical protein
MPSRVRRGPGVDQERNERRRLQSRDALTCWVVWWACQDLNLGPHPYQQSGAYRCATLRFRRWRATVEGQVMRSYVPADRRTDRTPRLRDKLEDQSVASKAMGLPGGRGSPIGQDDPGLGQLRRWTGRSAAMPGRRASCHQPRTVHRLWRGGRASRTSRAFSACARRSVMRCSASTWLSPACWLCMVLLPSCAQPHWSLLAQDGPGACRPNPAPAIHRRSWVPYLLAAARMATVPL